MSPDLPSDSSQPAGQHRGLKRAGGLLVAVVIGLVAVVGLLVLLNSRDDPGVDNAGGAGPGAAIAAGDQGFGPAQARLLRLGDVIIVYGTRRPPAELVALRDRLSGPPDPVLEAAGQAVVLERRAGVEGVEAHAHERVLRAASAADPQLEAFADYYLGRGDGDG